MFYTKRLPRKAESRRPKNIVQVLESSLLPNQDRFVVRLLGVMADGVELPRQTRKAARFAHKIGLMFRPESNCQRQPRSRVPFILSIDAEMIVGLRIKLARLEGLEQLSEVGFRRIQIGPTLIKRVERQWNQESKIGRNQTTPAPPIEVRSEPELMISSSLHEVFGNLVLHHIVAELKTIPRFGKLFWGREKYVRRKCGHCFRPIIYSENGINMRIGEQELVRGGGAKRVGLDGLALPPCLLAPIIENWRQWGSEKCSMAGVTQQTEKDAIAAA